MHNTRCPDSRSTLTPQPEPALEALASVDLVDGVFLTSDDDIYEHDDVGLVNGASPPIAPVTRPRPRITLIDGGLWPSRHRVEHVHSTTAEGEGENRC